MVTAKTPAAAACHDDRITRQARELGQILETLDPRESKHGTAIMLALMGIALAAFIGAAWWVSVPCHPGERGFYIGHAMLMAGCPDKPRLIYRDDGSVTPP